MDLTDIFRPEHICFVTVAKEIRLQGGGKTAHSVGQSVTTLSSEFSLNGQR